MLQEGRVDSLDPVFLLLFSPYRGEKKGIGLGRSTKGNWDGVLEL